MAEAQEFDVAQFREVVRHPQAHAQILGQYRIGEYAGVVALKRLLGEMRPEGKLHRAMEIHFHDEERHSRVFTEWMERCGVQPPAMPTELEGYFSTSPEEFRQQRAVLESLPAELRRIVVFAGINAVERGAFTQFENHLRCLERPDDVATLEGVIAEEKFHLAYVEAELQRQATGEHAAIVTTALEQARARFTEFQQLRRQETRALVERLLGGGA
jgi:hypothetical protein